MNLDPEQKKYVRLHAEELSVREMAAHLGVEPVDVRRAMAQLGLVPGEVRRRQEREARRLTRERRRASLLGLLGSFKRAGTGFGLVIGLALAVRLVQLLLVAGDPLLLGPQGQSAAWHTWAQQVAAGDWLGRAEPVFYHPPVYAWFLAGIYALAGPSPLAAAAVQTVLAALTAGLVLLVGRRVFGPVCGLLAGLGAAIYGPFVAFGPRLDPATLEVLLAAGCLAALLGGLQKPGWLRWSWAGLLLGWLVAARAELALLAPLVLLAVAGWFGWRQARRWAPAWALLTVGGVLGLAPLVLHNGLLGGDWLLLRADAGPRLSASLLDGPGETGPGEIGLGGRPGRSRPWLTETVAAIGSRPAVLWRGIGGNLHRYFRSREPRGPGQATSPRPESALPSWLPGLWLILPLGLVGLVISIRGLRKRGLLVAFVAAHLLGALLLGVSPSGRLAVGVVWLVYSAALIRWLGRKAAGRAWLRLAAVLGLIGLAFGVTL